MVDKEEKIEDEKKSIIKSNNFEERFSELEKISARARSFYLKEDENDRRIQKSNRDAVCGS
ncbi:hypothetical protein M0Q50_00080 [bacterium]|jgi:hypothetical protein|nr:hypothetical protein [bacterium]